VTRILVAGMGNVLRGDDGFGIRVIEKMRVQVALPPGTELYEAGTAGVALVQKLMDGFDACIIVDAAQRGGVPGSLYSITPRIAESAHRIGMHELDPSNLLALARAAGSLPETVVLIGCEPEQTEELCQELSLPVAAAINGGVSLVMRELMRLNVLTVD
jgi:hydrogenase maturation protease